MAEPVRLRGIAWDHSRGQDPLRATAERYRQRHPDVTITWDARSLRDFEEQSISALAERYDLLTIDHPFIGTAIRQGALVPLDNHLPADYLEDQRVNSVGASHASYQWDGHQWALAIDASAQTSAYRADLLTRFDMQVPRSWTDVVQLARGLPHGYAIAMPLNPTHLLCCFLAMCANRLEPHATRTDAAVMRWLHDGLSTSDVAMEVVEDLYNLSDYLQPLSFQADPIRVLDEMCTGDSIPYVPVTFAYCTYSRPRAGRRLVRFAALPSAGPTPRGAMLGGVGLALSRHCRNLDAAIGYMQAVASGPWQRGIYAESGGQPGHRSAWTDREVNRSYSRFFDATLETLDLSFVRPRRCCYPRYQQRAGAEMHEMFMTRRSPDEIVRRLGGLWREHLDAHAAHHGAMPRSQ